MQISELLLPEFDIEMANTRKLLELVPDGRFEYKPHQKSMTLGRLASHVAEMPSYVKPTLELEVLTIQPGEQPEIATSRQALLESFDKNVAEARKLIAAASDEELRKIWTFNFGERKVFSAPRVEVLRGMFLNHLIHHRAQLGVYLRMNEIEIPGMYGPSADEMKFWEASAA